MGNHLRTTGPVILPQFSDEETEDQGGKLIPLQLMVARGRTRLGTFLKILSHRKICDTIHLRQTVMMSDSYCRFLSESYSFSFFLLAVYWILLFHSQSAIFCFITKVALHRSCMVTGAGCELGGWCLGPRVLRFQCCALSHPSCLFVIYSFLPPLPLKKKSRIFWYIFGCRITPDGTFCLEKK